MIGTADWRSRAVLLFASYISVNDRNGRGAAPDGFVTEGGAQERRERRAQTDRRTEQRMPKYERVTQRECLYCLLTTLWTSNTEGKYMGSLLHTHNTSAWSTCVLPHHRALSAGSGNGNRSRVSVTASPRKAILQTLHSLSCAPSPPSPSSYRPPHRPLLPASSLVAPLPPSPVFQPSTARCLRYNKGGYGAMHGAVRAGNSNGHQSLSLLKLNIATLCESLTSEHAMLFAPL
jgi:hypothetical protein